MRPTDRRERWSWLASQSTLLRRSLGRVLPPEEADDVTQEALLRIAGSRAPIPTDRRADWWLLRVARNIGVDRWRRRKREFPLDSAGHVPALPEGVAERVDLVAALGRLSDRDRHVLGLVAAGVRYDEIARTEKMSLAAVRQRVARARARLLLLLREVDR